MVSHVVTVEFTVNAEEAPDLSAEESAVEAIHAALATVVNMVNHSPGTDALLSHLTNYTVRRVD